MLTRRDVAVGLFSACAALGVAGSVGSQVPVMSSSIFDWNSVEARSTEVGEVRDFFRSATATLDELELHVTTLNPGLSSHAPHQHPAEELIIVKEGLVEALVNGQMQRVGPGSVIFQASNQMHSIRNVGEVPATYHVIQWQSPGMLRPRAAER